MGNLPIRLTLEQLSEATGIEPRTIRDYIAKDLIPPPEGRSRGAFYTEAHLRTLRLIRTLREDYGLPLDEIRRHLLMARGDEEAVYARLHIAPPSRRRMHWSSFVQESPPAEDFSGAVESFAMMSPPLRPQSDRSPLAQLVTALNRLVGRIPQHRPGRGVPCMFFDVTPDIALQVKGEYAPHEVALFERLAACLREALTRGVHAAQTEDGESER